MSDLKRLQGIRQRRMEKQLAEVQAHRNIVANCEQRIIDHKQKIANFHQWRMDEQEQLFKNLQSQPFSPQAMDEYRNTLEKLRLQEQQLVDELTTLGAQLENAKTGLQKAGEAAKKLTLQNEKMKEIVEIEHSEQPQEGEKTEA